MSRHTPIDRFTLPRDIPEHIPDQVPGEIPSPTDACWSQPGGCDPADHAPAPVNTPAHSQASASDGEAARGYVMRSAAGRGWAPEEEARETVTIVQGLPCTAEDLRLMALDVDAAHPAATRASCADPSSAPHPLAGGAGGGRLLDPPSKPGPAPLLTPRKQAAFCSALAGHGNVRLACRAVQVSPQTAYRARRASWQFRQCWDAALVLARDHAEQVLADRALNGVEEKVFYHGEEVATRTRYSDRLLLAHLARLDKRAEARETCEDCDAALLREDDFDEAVEALQEGEAEEAPVFAPAQCSMCSTFAGPDAATPPREEPEDRLAAMEAALPPGAQAQSGLSDAQWRWAEPERLAAWEAGKAEWWLAAEEAASGSAGG